MSQDRRLNDVLINLAQGAAPIVSKIETNESSGESSLIASPQPVINNNLTDTPVAANAPLSPCAFVEWSKWPKPSCLFDTLEYYGQRLVIIFDRKNGRKGLQLAALAYRRNTARVVRINWHAAHMAEIELVPG